MIRKNLPAIGQSYKHDDLPLSAQVTRNWYPEVNIETSRALSLQPFPGGTVFSTGLGGNDRGVTFWNGFIYKVYGTRLYKIDSDGNQSSVNDIDGTGMCSFPASAEWLVIVSSGNVYLHNGSTTQKLTDPELEDPDYGAFLNNHWIYQGNDGRFVVSDAGQPGQINALNYATAESDGDPLVRVYVYNQLLYLFGSRTIETWWNSGSGNPPFNRVEGGIAQKGCAAADSVSHNDNYIYFLGDDRLIYQMQGSQTRSISTIPLAQIFNDYDDVSDAVGFCYTYAGQYFYQLKVGDNAWVFNENSGAWFEVTIELDEKPHPATSYVYAYGKHLFSDDSNLMELDRSNSLYNALPIVRERITGLISGDLLGEEYIGRYIFHHRVEIIIKGVPPIGDAPQIMLTWSDDAGYTWSNERVIDCGVLGNYTFRAETHQLGRARERVYKIRISDESSYAIHRMTGDFSVG